MTANPSLEPIGPAQFDQLAAQHLLNRAGFGGTPGQVRALVKMGLNRAVDHLVEYQRVELGDLPKPQADPDIIRPQTAEERAAYQLALRNEDRQTLEKLRAERIRREGQDRQQMHDLEQWWIEHMIATPRPLEEKLTLLWHSHFASNHRTVRDSYLMQQQNALLRQHASGNFGDLVQGIIRDPAMIRFLDNQTNRKSHPNENLARELMELFTLGEGNYSEDDIKEGARALTGYTFRDNDFVFEQRQHDPGMKNLLGKRGKFDGQEFVNLILDKPVCAQFVAYKLYRHFVADVPDPRQLSAPARNVILQMGQRLYESQYQLKPVLKTLFKSRHFYDPAIVGNMIKSPVQLLVGTVRILNTPIRQTNAINATMNLMGQMLYNPPSVAGWDGGRSWLNSSTLFVRQNLAAYLITGRTAGGYRASQTSYDPSFLLEDLADRSPAAVVDRLMDTLLGTNKLPQRRAELLAYAQQRGQADSLQTLTELLLLITAIPEYQLC